MSKTCSDCKYMYSNETMGELHICVNGNSDMLGNFVGIMDETECPDCENNFDIEEDI